MRTSLLCALFIALIFTSCKKTEPDGPLRNGASKEVNFNNRLNVPVTLRVYRDIDDYKRSVNPVLVTTVEPNDRYLWPVPENVDKYYYVDWYSDNYVYGNWGYRKFAGAFPEEVPNALRYEFLLPVMGVVNNIYYFNTNMLNNGYGRNIVLWNGNEPETVWKSMDVIDLYGSYYKSIRNKLPGYQLYHELVFRKDMTCTYSSKYPNGGLKKINTNYELVKGTTPMQRLKVYSEQGEHVYWDVYNNKYAPNYYQYYARDTMMMQTEYGYVVLLRQ